MLKVDFSIREACKLLANPQNRRWQRGCVEKITGKRGKSWKLRWYEYERQADGGEKRAHRSRTLDAETYSRAEAHNILAEIIQIYQDKARGVVRLDRDVTLDSFYREIFLPTRKWEKSTTRSLGYIYKNYVQPEFGERKLPDIRKHHVDRFFQSLEGKGISILTQARSVLSGVLGYAAENSYIDRNPMGRVHISKLAKRQPKAKVLTLEQARAVCAMSGVHGLVYRVLMLCGLRCGEMLALRWEDVRTHILVVDESIESCGDVKGTKTGETREVPLPESLAAELIARREQAEHNQPRDFIFGRLDGHHYVHNSARLRWLIPARIDSGIPTLDFHTCRRTCATLLKDRGHAQTADVQAILGHSQPETTEKHYIKPVEASQHRAIAQLSEDLLGKTTN